MWVLLFIVSLLNLEAHSEVERLATLGRVWGQVKLFHPKIITDGPDWDQALIETIPKVSDANTKEAYAAAFQHLFSFLDDPLTRVIGLPELEMSRASFEKINYVELLDEHTQYFVLGEASALTDLLKGKRKALVETYEQCSPDQKIIFDLRGFQANEYKKYYIKSGFRELIKVLTATDFLFPSERERMHQGFANGQGTFFSAWITRQHEYFATNAARYHKGEMVFLLDDGASFLVDELMGLQAQGVKIVYIGASPGYLREGKTEDVPLLYGLTARIRTSEHVGVDGQPGLIPDLCLAKLEKIGDVFSLLKGARRKALPEALPGGFMKPDKRYKEDAYPSKELRILGLFRFWNYIHYFYPYKHLMDEPWDHRLEEFLPLFIEAEDALAYNLAIMKLAAKTNDSHTTAYSAVITEKWGSYLPPIEALYVEDQLCVVHVHEGAGPVKQGDVILGIDGVPVKTLAQENKPYFAHSTPQGLRARFRFQFLLGSKGELVSLQMRRPNGEQYEVQLKRTHSFRWNQTSKRKSVEKLAEGFGYLDLTQLSQEEVQGAFESLGELPGLIFDLRGYPNGTAWAITPHLTSEDTISAQLGLSLALSPSELVEGRYNLGLVVPYDEKIKDYKGQIVILTNELAISQSEHSCLMFEAATDKVTYIGTPTNGANGDITHFFLPGSVRVRFSGLEVKFADGRQLQRKGIQPDVWVAPTVKGIAEGQDEVLSAAIKYLQAADVADGEKLPAHGGTEER